MFCFSWEYMTQVLPGEDLWWVLSLTSTRSCPWVLHQEESESLHLVIRSYIIIIIIIKLGFCIALYHTPKGCIKELNICFCKVCGAKFWSMRHIPLKHHVMVYKVLWRNMLPIRPGTPGRTPSLFDKCTGFFYMRYTTHGTNGFTSHPKDEAMVKCLA